MVNKIDEFIQNLNIESSKLYSKTYFNIIFSDDELKKILPFIKNSWKDYLDLNKRKTFIDQLTVASSLNTTNKVLVIINKLSKFYNINSI